MENSINISTDKVRAYYVYVFLLLLVVGAAFYLENTYIALAPFMVLGVVLTIIDFRFLYYGFFALLPFSIEVQFGPLGTDLPSEPIMLALTGVSVLLGLKHFKDIPRKVVYHPITALLVIHVLWIGITTIFSLTPVISLKFFLAKIWYVAPFYFLTIYMLKEDKDVLQLFRYSGVFLLSAVVIVLYRHWGYGFTFDTSNTVVYPIFRNHVSYASMLVVVIPYVWALWRYQKVRWLLVGLGAMVIGTYFSYTRAAHLCLFIMVGGYFIFRYRFVKLALTSTLIGGILLSIYMIDNNRYLNFAPDFEKTITHKQFDNLVEATYKLEDISTMERVYRWVAGAYMIGERPIIGYGPSGFYSNYKKFTVTSFETYVSHNPEHSGIHCYYLMTWVEQGLIGLIIFLALCFVILLMGQRAYHGHDDPISKLIIMAACLSTLSILALLLINDLIEADKVGPFFFVNAAIIAIYDMKREKRRSYVG